MANKPVGSLPGTAASDPKRQLLARLLKREGMPSQVPHRILRRLGGTAAPLSFAQQRLWFLQQWEPANPVYNLARAYRLNGPLEGAWLARSLEAICQRHEILRSTFPQVGDHPVQQFSQATAPQLHRVDLRQRPRRARDNELARLVSTEARHGFDLASEPLLRLSLVQLDTDDHVLILVAHQIICDGRSLDIFYRELETLYAKGGAVGRASLPELSVQYADYAAWQREALNDSALASELSYWKTRLGGQLPILELPADRPRRALPTLLGARRKFLIGEAVTGALKDLSRKSSTTLFVTLMAAFKVLLFRYSAQADIIVGFPIATRDGPEMENLIGSFVNTLPLRSDLSGDPSFRTLLARVRVATQGALAHHDLPFERLVEEFPRERDLSRNPLFQTMFTFQNRLPAELNLRGIHAEPIDCVSGMSKFDLTLSLGERDGRLLGSFEYSSELFDAPTIDRMIGHFQTLLNAIVADPDRSISALPLLRPAERRRILVEWNDTAGYFPKDRCVHQLVEAQALRTPNAVAVAWAGQKLTYRELNRRANRLARYLRQGGLGPDKVAAVCVE
ncbi:MAG TPA: condensation domain-containing protein, partial [Acidobacteriota bacterium]|nr:condensation domain-containing protein [Acidobacteriota bacterium]